MFSTLLVFKQLICLVNVCLAARTCNLVFILRTAVFESILNSRMKSQFLCFFFFAICCSCVSSQRRLVCLDNQADVEGGGWTVVNTNMKSAQNSRMLPKSFGDLKSLDGEGIWYFDGSGVGNNKEIVLKSPPNMYGGKGPTPKSVNMYIKYYDNSPRRVSLFPATGSNAGPLQLLPVSSNGKWTEVRQEIDPKQSPIELTAYLSGSNQFILFEKIVVAVDSPLPSDLSLSCAALTAPPTIPPSASIATSTRKPSTPSSGASTSSISGNYQRSECPALPQLPECKCNCNCNCAKC